MMLRLNRQNLPLVAGILCLLFLFQDSGTIFSLQNDTDWSPLRRIVGYEDDTFPPIMIADQNQTVHAFVSQQVGEDVPKNAIIYRQWSAEGGWTNPVDILLSPEGETKVYGAFLDQKGTIHLLFQAGDATGASVYYSRAPITDAGRATSWSEPEVIGERAIVPGSGAITGDENGNLAVIYNGNGAGNGVYAIHSSDRGLSWSEPELVYLTYEPDLIPFSLQMIRGQDGQVHAVWNVVTDLGVDESLFYASLDLDNNEWSMPLLLDQRIEEADFFGPSFPAIADSNQGLVIMYNSGNLNEKSEVAEGRPVQVVRLSKNGGATWSDAIYPFPAHLGRSGSHALVVDGDGVAHAMFIQRVEFVDSERYAPIGGLWHSTLIDDGWSEPALNDLGAYDLGAFSGHDIQAVVSQGNRLLVTLREDPGADELGVWYMAAALNAAETPSMTPEVILPAEIEDPVAIPTAATMRTNRSSDSIGSEMLEQTLNVSENNPARPILLGLLPVIVILLGIIIAFQLVRFRV